MVNTGGVYTWSQTQANNATADNTVNWAEGQAPSTVNDSARNMMASTAKWRDDISGAILTGGTSTAYTLTSYQVFDTLVNMHQKVIAFTPHATNGGFCSLNVDGLGSRNIRSAPGVDIPQGTLIQGTPYAATYNNSDGMFYLHSFFGNPYNIPIGATIDYWLPTAPSSSFVFPFGQAISRTTYSTLFASMGTTYGTGDGSTTFNIPDLRGRTLACPDNMGGSDANRLTASSSIAGQRNSVGGVGGEAAHTITIGEMPSHNHTATDSGHLHTLPSNTVFNTSGAIVSGGAGAPLNPVGGTTTLSGTANVTIGFTGGGTAANVVQPTILCNRIMRII